MVAIVVILAAVIAAFVFGMAGSVSTTKSVGATAMASTDDSTTPPTKVITVTYQGGKDSSEVASLVTKAIDPSGTAVLAGSITDFAPGTAPSVGDTAVIKGLTAGDKYHIIVTAGFNDGSEQVVLDTFV